MERIKKYKGIATVILCVLAYFYFNAIPETLFDDEYSRVLYDQNGGLLGARIAKDGQWRFEPSIELPDKYKQCLISYEDKRFYKHWGVDIISIINAFKQNIAANKIVRGGSTIPMQIMRLAAENPKRNIFNKVKETIQATRLEFRYSKQELLQLYAGHAPFGGNVVGLEAASWRYYGKSPNLLSWAECAMLAVLPNAPGLIHPGRNRDQLTTKRNRLLKLLLENNKIDSIDYELSLLEPIPEKPQELPSWTPHLLDDSELFGNKTKVNSTINKDIQMMAINVANNRYLNLKETGINNLAILILDTHSGNVLAYIGNAPKGKSEENIDMINVPRSTGSLLKPFLYAYSMDDGLIRPKSLLQDVPIYLNGFHPENYDKSYRGVVHADEALVNSLNVPFVLLLKEFGIEKFLNKLKKQHLHGINRDANFYGLSLILGGAEASLWDLTGSFSSLGRILIDFQKEQSKYSSIPFSNPNLFSTNIRKETFSFDKTSLGAGAIWHTFETMSALKRPDENGEWELFNSTKKIAWKTGTSFGHRDAWAIGVNPDYTIGVWVGNANNKGVAGLVGVKKAAPILFDLHNRLVSEDWFQVPYDDLILKPICTASGELAQKFCFDRDTSYLPNVIGPLKCNYHDLVHLDENESYQVNSTCYDLSKIVSIPWFNLPPLPASYYKLNNVDYRELPPFAKGCESNYRNTLAFIYPPDNGEIFIPNNLKNKKENVIFEASHSDKDGVIYWYLDEVYLGSTINFHTVALQPSNGQHLITIVDNEGQKVTRLFTVIEQ